jgi:epoxyqueuosine reductase
MNKALLSGFIKTEALRTGFADCGIARAQHLSDEAERMEEWLSEGRQADMTYLERNKEKRYDPAKLVEGTRSVITVLYNYYPEKKLPEDDNYKISKYAYGKDYHYIVKQRLTRLLAAIETKTGKRKARLFVDSAPVLDRAWARQSGLGFIGKNTMLIHKKKGSFLFIGHIILDLELDYDEAETNNYCGSCTLCIDACPAGALEPFRLDARKCISYLTIENRGEIDTRFKGKMNDWIFGCDICQDVCPWNRFSSPHKEPLFDLQEELIRMKKKDWETLNNSRFKTLFKNSAVERTGFKGMKRNIEFVAENANFRH